MSAHTDLQACRWQADRLGEAMEELARRAGLKPNAQAGLMVPDFAAQDNSAEERGRWVEWAAQRLGIEAEATATPASGFGELILRAGPAVLHIAIDGAAEADAGFFLLLKSRGQTLQLIGPDLQTHRCPAETLRAALCAPYETPFAAEIDRLLHTAQVPQQRWPQVRAAMLRERLATYPMGQCWQLRPSPASSFWQQLAQARLPRRLGLMLAAFTVVYGLEAVGWGLIGRTTLNGHLDMGWIAAWALLVVSLVPLKLMGGWLDSTFALDVGRMLKTRLMAGALRIDLEVVRRQGAGQLLSRVMESQALESLALNGGLGVLIALLELMMAAAVLALGAGGRFHLLLLVVWLALTLALSGRYAQCLRRWTLMRLDLTHALVERMVGHKTQLAQERPARRAEQEDQAMKDYLSTSQAMDRAIVPVAGLMPRGWMLLGLLGLAPAFAAGTGSAGDLAIGLGGMFLANRALTGISGGVSALARAAVAWGQVAALFRSAGQALATGPYLTSAQISGELTGKLTGEGRTLALSGRSKLVDASQLVFRYRELGEPVLRGVDLSIYRGERILLEGSSGGGKSTLASLLVGLRPPESGLLLLNGLDRHTLGDAWQQIATEAPQFHENHILSASLGFNLLMGRNWPATGEELKEAQDLCEELGLGELLQKMPAGMRQMVGETGWQLSHGERARIFLARALLQKAQLTVLDESFAALDPETLEKCLSCALGRAQTLLVIAHP
jgi:ATP-binding cassette, subfamily B, bacterial